MVGRYRSRLLSDVGDLHGRSAISRYTDQERFWLDRLGAAVNRYNYADYGNAASICREEIIKQDGVPSDVCEEALELLANIKGLRGRLGYAQSLVKIAEDRLVHNMNDSVSKEALQRAQDLVIQAQADTEIKIARPFFSTLLLRLMVSPKWAYTAEEKESIQSHKKAIEFYQSGQHDECIKICLENVQNAHALEEVQAEACELLASSDSVEDRVGYAMKYVDLKKKQFESSKFSPSKVKYSLAARTQFLEWVKAEVVADAMAAGEVTGREDGTENTSDDSVLASLEILSLR